MKKWLIGISVIALILLVSVYILIPSQIKISKVIHVKCSINGVNRFVADETKWTAWWPAKNAANSNINGKADQAFNYNQLAYRVKQKFYNSIVVNISDGNSIDSSRLNVLKTSVDSTILEWKCQFTSSRNPVTRFRDYRKAIRISENMTSILIKLGVFLENPANIYGVNIQQIISKDSTLIFTQRVTNSYPTTPEIYELISMLKKHIAGQGAAINNFPMLNVRPLPGNKFETLVAIPVNGKLMETSTIVNKRFVPWKTLTGDVKGGVHSVEQAMKQMKIYIEDYQRNAMGIPFQLLITDRSMEPDTSKWVTKICQAVS